MAKEAKTNAMRFLEKEKVAYTAHEYPHEEGVAVDGATVARSMGQDPACVFKTLVTQGASREYFVFVIPVEAELDLKAAARSVGEKSVAMIHVADINKVTGYVRGGCSPIPRKNRRGWTIMRCVRRFSARSKRFGMAGRVRRLSVSVPPRGSG